ncbi:hypothetical protein U1Q18_011831 [Sarracenia purpurea var. burkii]
MASIPSIHTCAILLALIAYNEILFTEGRQLKAKEKVENNSTHDQNETGRHGSQSINSQKNDEGQTQGYDLSAPHAIHVPISDHSTAGKKDVLPTITLEGHKDDFRSTTPGNSPGVGHSFPGQKDHTQKNAQNKSAYFSHSVEGDINDFKPTGPGHSPGIGHSFQNTNAEGNP